MPRIVTMPSDRPSDWSERIATGVAGAIVTLGRVAATVTAPAAPPTASNPAAASARRLPRKLKPFFGAL
ncbi:hypothetical protein EQZ23_06115 [Sphingomonas sp. UV9]|nr:hypothetical protein EQZ23_06115 [Sphingomonas sp. UV9]